MEEFKNIPENLKNIVESKKGKLLECDYKNKFSILKIECDKGHIWESRYTKIVNGSWCHTCGLSQKDETKQKISKSLSKFLQSEEGVHNRKIAQEKRSETMRKQKEQIQQNMTKKLCKKCGKTKPVESFHKKYNAKDGLQTNCKTCINAIKRKNRKENAKFKDLLQT